MVKVLTKQGKWVSPKKHPNPDDYHIPQDMFDQMEHLLDIN